MSGKSRHSACAMVLLLFAGLVLAQEPDKEKAAPQAEEAKASKSKAESHKVKPGPFKIEVSLDGVFEASELSEVALRPETWSEFTVQEAVEQGAAVKKGDLLIQLDTRKIDEAIRDLQTERDLARLSLKQAEAELAALEKSLEFSLASVQRSKKLADEDLRFFLESDRETAEKQAEFMVKQSTFWLRFAEEELRQLEKMYKADDLTEETEEIILEQARQGVESGKFSLENAQIRRDKTVKIELPRQQERLTETSKQQTLALEKTRVMLPLEVRVKRLALEKLVYQDQKTAERMDDLQQDRAMMMVQSPADGIVYYGQCQRGKWSGATTTASLLRAGGKLTPHQVVITIVSPGPLLVRAEVPESELEHLRQGLQGYAVPSGFSQQRLAVKLDELSTTPLGDKKFDARLSLVDDDGDVENLVAGMTCKITLRPYSKSDALAVPASAVFRDELDEEQRYVYRLTKDGDPEKREVQAGLESEERVEIVAGLESGDEILLKRPKDKGDD